MKKQKQSGIGIDIVPPKETCKDKKCPYHGNLKPRGRLFVGKVVGGDTHRTVNIEWPRLLFIKKYERYEKRRTRVKAHNPSCINAKVGDTVKIAETRPMSKTKNFVVLQVLEEKS